MSEIWDSHTELALCATISLESHKGQYRRDGLTPYIDHPKEVARSLRTFDEKCIGWLHDVLEDTGMTAEGLRERGVPERIIVAVIAITKRKGESYTAYLCRIRENPLATAVKIADMLHNISDNATEKQIIKYSKGFIFLLDED